VADDVEEIAKPRGVLRPEARAVAAVGAGADLAVLGGRARQRERLRELWDVEIGKHQRDRKRPRPCPVQRFEEIRIERRELFVGGLFRQLRVRPEPLQRSLFGRIVGHERELVA
jgi:hypothetical protein